MLCIICMSAALKSLVEAGSFGDGIMSCIIFCIAAGSIMLPMGMTPDIGMLPWP
jgi:cyanate lyase